MAHVCAGKLVNIDQAMQRKFKAAIFTLKLLYSIFSSFIGFRVDNIHSQKQCLVGIW